MKKIESDGFAILMPSFNHPQILPIYFNTYGEAVNSCVALKLPIVAIIKTHTTLIEDE